MNLDRARAIGEQIVAFLRDALERRVPERDVPLAEAIRRKMLEALPEGDDQAAWRAWREAVVEPIVEAFSGAAERWELTIHLVSIYFSSLQTASPHPLAHPTETITAPGGVVMRPIRLDLGPFVLAGLFRTAPGERVRFIDGMQSWNALRAITPLLGALELEVTEAAALIRRVDAFPHNDLASTEPLRALRGWIRAHPAIGRQIVDAWLEEEPWTAGLQASAIQILVEGVTSVGPEQLEWRAGVLDRLAQSNDENLWALMVWLSCIAWPEPMPPARERHDAMLKRVMRLPARLIDHGLGAVARDAREHPQEAVETAVRLIQLSERVGPRDADAVQRWAAKVVSIAWRVVEGARERALSVPDLRPLLGTLVVVSPEAARRDLDYLLDLLDPIDPALVRDFLAQWAAIHENDLRRVPLRFDDVFPTFGSRLGPEGVAHRLLSLMVHSDRVTRRVAAGFLSSARHALVPDGFLEGLAPREVDALAHEFFGCVVDPSVCVPLLFAIAERCPEHVKLIRTIVIDDIAEDYPDACRSAALKLPASGDAGTQEVTKLRAEVLARLDEADALHVKARSVPDLSALRPGRHAWHQVQNRVFQEGEREARQSGRYVFLSLMPPVYFARGEAIAPSRPGEEPTRFESYSGAIELPRRELIDPLTFRYQCVWHRARAEELLARKERP